MGLGFMKPPRSESGARPVGPLLQQVHPERRAGDIWRPGLWHGRARPARQRGGPGRAAGGHRAPLLLLRQAPAARVAQQVAPPLGCVQPVQRVRQALRNNQGVASQLLHL